MKRKNIDKVALSNARRDEIRMLEDEINKLAEKFYRIKDYPMAAHSNINNLYFNIAGGKIPEHEIIDAHKDLIQDLNVLLAELKESLNNGFSEFILKDFRNE